MHTKKDPVYARLTLLRGDKTRGEVAEENLPGGNPNSQITRERFFCSDNRSDNRLDNRTERFSLLLFQPTDYGTDFVEILRPTDKCDELSARPLTPEPNVDRRPSNVRARSCRRATGASCSFLRPVTSVYISVCGGGMNDRLMWRLKPHWFE